MKQTCSSHWICSLQTFEKNHMVVVVQMLMRIFSPLQFLWFRHYFFTHLATDEFPYTCALVNFLF